MSKQHFKFEPGDQVLHLLFDPPDRGVVTGKDKEPDTYNVRIADRAEDIRVHARNLKKA